MTKASITLPDGTSVVIDGTPEEVAKLLALYGGSSPDGSGQSSKIKQKPGNRKTPRRESNSPKSKQGEEDESANLISIIETIRNCDQAEDIESKVLDKAGQVNRILLPLFIVHEHLDNAFGLTSGQISRITTDLGVPVQTPNASHTLSGTASKYVIGDTVRKKGQPVRYKLSRRGVQYFKEVLDGGADGK